MGRKLIPAIVIKNLYAADEDRQKFVRTWWITNYPEKCEYITNFRNNWIGREFGMRYFSPSSIEDYHGGWEGCRICIGEGWYLKWKDKDTARGINPPLYKKILTLILTFFNIYHCSY